jgi:hypothetical protein
MTAPLGLARLSAILAGQPLFALGPKHRRPPPERLVTFKRFQVLEVAIAMIKAASPFSHETLM